MKDLIEKERARLDQLMDESRTRVTLRVVPARPAAAELGALDGVGYEADNPAVHAVVYIFERSGPQADAVAKLRAGAPGDGDVRVLHGINGRMLFFGYTRIDGDDGHLAKYRLNDMISAFSGDE